MADISDENLNDIVNVIIKKLSESDGYFITEKRHKEIKGLDAYQEFWTKSLDNLALDVEKKILEIEIKRLELVKLKTDVE